MAEQYLYLEVLPTLTANEVGGFSRSATRRRGIAAAAALSSSGEFRMFRQGDCRNLVEHLRSAKCVVGYNCIKFDYELIRGQVPFRRPKTIDLMLVLVEAADRPVSMSQAARGTLGRQRLPDCHAPVPVTNPEGWSKVSKSLKLHLGILRQLHEHLATNGVMELTEHGKKRQVVIHTGKLG